MKRVSALICLMIMAVSILAPSCFAAKETANTQKGANFKIEKTTPENNAKNVSVENLSVKIYFDTEMLPKDKASREANAKQFKLTDKKGKKIPIKVYYSHKEEGLVMVVSDTVKKDIQIEGDTEYDLTIGKNLTSTDGTKMGVSHKLHFKTLDQKGSTRIYMIMMVVMIVGMIFFSSRSAKKAMEKEKEEKGKSETVNPYKEAKRTGKSVEEIVEKDKKRKAKQAEAEEKRRAEEKKIQEEVAEKLRKESNKRVSKARPISAAFAGLGALFGGSAGLPRFDAKHTISWIQWAWFLGIVAAAILAGLCYLFFAKVSEKLGEMLQNHRIVSCVLAGVCIATGMYFLPLTTFSGEHEMGELMSSWEEYSAKILILTALAKMLLVNLCISLGWRGGSIFPLIFSGVAAGYAFAAITGIDPNFAVAAMTAGLYGYVSRKPVMTVAVLLMCFPPVYIFPLAGAAVIASKVPIPPKMHEEEKNCR